MDASIRFDLAYKHSQAENKDMALHHYDKIPSVQRNPTTWNNIGVSYGEFQMPVRSVRAFRLAEAESETLAMSNLGFQFLGTGFFKEAKELCDRALAIEGHHKNAVALLDRLTAADEEETEKFKETLEAVKKKAEFYRALGQAIVMETPGWVAPKWKSWEGVFDVILDGPAITLSGKFERSANALFRALGSPIGTATVFEDVLFTGEVWGHIVVGTVLRKTKGERASLLAEGSATPKVVMYFDGDCKELFVMENPQSVSPTFYSFTADAWQ
jgi:tetratricopeptide (TPR) repeat protein